MSEENKMDGILQAIPWRCYHCDFITNDPAEAQSHFGDNDDPSEFTPICKWWSGKDEVECLSAYQDLQRDFVKEQNENYSLRKQIEGLEYQVDSNRSRVWSGYRPFRECTSINEIFCVYDSMEGRALAAEEKVKNLTKSLRDAVDRIKGREYTADLLAVADTGGIA